MIGFARDVRLIPLVLLAMICLLALKFSGLVFDGGYTVGERLANRAKPPGLTIADPSTIPETPVIIDANASTPGKKSWAQDVFNFPSSDITGSVGKDKPKSMPKAMPKEMSNDISMSDITGSAGGGHGEAKKPEAPKAPPPAADPGGTVIPTEPPQPTPVGERAVLERLQERREELDARARQLEMRENLLKQAEGRLDAKLTTLKGLEEKSQTDGAGREKAEINRLKTLASMYENMKPKDAARIFDRLELKILVDVTNQINPRKMSDILGQMSSEAAERLTVELARRSMSDHSGGAMQADLPKIEGQSGDRPQINGQKGL